MGFTRSPEDHSDGRNFDDWRTAQGGFRMDWKKDSRDTFTLQGDLYSEEAGQSVTATSYTPPYSQTLNANAQVSGGNIMGRWTRDMGNGTDFQVQVYYDRTNRRQPNFTDLRDTFDMDFLQHLRWHGPAAPDVGPGCSRQSRGIRPGDRFRLDLRTPTAHRCALHPPSFRMRSALVERRLSLTVGTTNVLRTNFTSIGLEPSARLLWSPSDRQSVWLAFTHALRTPSDGESDFNLSGYITTTATGVPYFARFIANPGFAPEQLNGYELGYRRLLGKKLYLDRRDIL